MTKEQIEGDKLIAEFDVPNWMDLKKHNYKGTIPTEKIQVAAILPAYGLCFLAACFVLHYITSAVF